MNPTWAERLARRMVGWYPRRWRERYAEEILEVLDQHQVSVRTVVNLAANAAATRLDPAYRPATSATLRRFLRTGAALLATVAAMPAAFVGVQLAFGEETEFGMTGAHGLAVSGDGRLVATSSGASRVRLWNITDPRHPMLLSHFDAGTTLAVSPDAHTLAVIGKRVTLWNITDPTRPARAAALPEYTRHASAMAFAPDSRSLAVGYHGGVLVYDVTDPARPRSLTPPPRQPADDSSHDIGPSQFSPDGRLLAIKSGGSDQVTLWSLADRSAPRSLTTVVFGHDEPPFGDLAFSPDGATLATATVHGHLTLWNVTDPASPTVASSMDDGPVGPAPDATVGSVLAFSLDGRTLSSVLGSVRSVRWDVTDRTRCRHVDDLTRADAGPGSFMLTPDGRALVSAAHGADTLHVWTL
ncbi:WD40 repeat domain-containing protein [Actinoplanes subtropicus]|uniref:WD40 repeat domain-containing protein n=1 Tax=Actinoplanes subtropicus TaxID=543632 RepID=UPI0012FADD64|nr:WD40 repeat domain-containing protein [Actinoplanes subtropicus]